jgi:holo-[acyl-carrier protein] synthase
MILGVGIDLVDIFRIDRILEKYPRQFAKRVLGKRELGTYEKILFSDLRPKEKANRFIAKRLAAKEAVSKAFGTGLRGQISLKTIEVLNDSLGKPYVVVSPLKDKIMLPYFKKIHISLTDENNFAQAIAILEG